MKTRTLLLIAGFACIFSNHVIAQAPVLGSAEGFVLFTGTGAITNTGISHITGNVGTNSGAITDFGNVNGVMHTTDAATLLCKADLQLAYEQINSAVQTNVHAPALGNETLNAGVYDISGNTTLSNDLTLDAQNNPDAVFIFRMSAPFSATASSRIILINGALACRVFWKVEGAVNIASLATIRGTIIANNGAIDLASGVTLDGRALSTTGAITLNNTMAKVPSGCSGVVLAGPMAPFLASTACYVLFSGNGAMTNAGTSFATGDIGTNVGITGGFAPLNVTGKIHPIPDVSTAQCASDLLTVYNYLNLLPHDIELLFPAQFGNDLVLTPHTYLLNAATSFNGNLYLNAEQNTDAIFVIKINGALSTGTFSSVILMNGAQAKNVYWKVDGATTINDFSVFKGTLISNNAAISINTGVNLQGRALTTNGAFSTAAINANIPGLAACSLLPLRLLKFTGNRQGYDALLNWKTSGESNTSAFDIEQSTDGTNFNIAGTVTAAGSSSGEKDYAFRVKNIGLSNDILFYRLNMKDNDARSSYSNVVKVVFPGKTSLQVSPNPVSQTITLSIASKKAETAYIQMIDVAGRVVFSTNKKLLAGTNSLQENVQSFAPGLYTIKITATQAFENQQFIKN
ncbi:ice-binding family protein [Ferruginibacter sp. HRS2-29]|uniref:ice-binding family protein n=1 Tax=Ferruginibacter sp. HRS2-29 TaxID=2487334 RepID=UPI0020CE763D|nr:ice-binding family protein [Ferruginibacter sp. HRS2-29]MCP9750981.1 DUF3494 domain-containing protein [Ferruginibacter sp. HRS2-29]